MALDICNGSSGLIKIITTIISHPTDSALGLGILIWCYWSDQVSEHIMCMYHYECNSLQHHLIPQFT